MTQPTTAIVRRTAAVAASRALRRRADSHDEHCRDDEQEQAAVRGDVAEVDPAGSGRRVAELGRPDPFGACAHRDVGGQRSDERQSERETPRPVGRVRAGGEGDGRRRGGGSDERYGAGHMHEER